MRTLLISKGTPLTGAFPFEGSVSGEVSLPRGSTVNPRLSPFNKSSSLSSEISISLSLLSSSIAAFRSAERAELAAARLTIIESSVGRMGKGAAAGTKGLMLAITCFVPLVVDVVFESRPTDMVVAGIVSGTRGGAAAADLGVLVDGPGCGAGGRGRMGTHEGVRTYGICMAAVLG